MYWTGRKPGVRFAAAVYVALVATLALTPTPLAGSTSGPRTQKIAAQFVYESNNSDANCAWGIGVQFQSVPGATSYVVDYYDREYKRVISTPATPKQLTIDPAGRGALVLGVTGGTYSPPCQDGDGDPTESGRFSKGATVTAIFPRKSLLVSGHVTKCSPGPFGCVDARPRSGVSITARRKGGGGATAYSGSDGAYRMALSKKGAYLFTPHDVGIGDKGAITDYLSGPRTIQIAGNRAGVDFSGYNHADLAPPPASLFHNAPPGTIMVVSVTSALDPSRPAVTYVKRGGTGPATPLKQGDFLQKGDIVGTNDSTGVVLESALGERIGLNKSSQIELDGVRSVNSTTPQHVTVDTGGLWAKCGALKEPIEIQTNGGTMGIKG